MPFSENWSLSFKELNYNRLIEEIEHICIINVFFQKTDHFHLKELYYDRLIEEIEHICIINVCVIKIFSILNRPMGY